MRGFDQVPLPFFFLIFACLTGQVRKIAYVEIITHLAKERYKVARSKIMEIERRVANEYRQCTTNHASYHLPFRAIILENAEHRFTDVYLSDFTSN